MRSVAPQTILNRSLFSELLEDMTSKKLLPVLSTGVVAGILFVIIEVSLAAMVYSRGLSPLASRGASLALSGGFLICFAGAFASSFKGTISMPQDTAAALLSAVAATVAASLGDTTAMEIKFMTVAAVLAFSAFLAGVVFIIVGRFRLANLLRFMPYPVVGGFLAGTGFLLVMGGINVMAGMAVSLDTLSQLATLDMMSRWLPGVVYGAALFVIMLRWSHFLILPGSLIAALALFYLAFAVCGISTEGARAAGFLVTGVPANGLWPAFTLKDLALIDWATVWQQLPGMLTVALITVVGMLLNMSGIELAAGEEIDMNGEFVAGGAANCLAGLGGCFPGYPAISLSLLGLRAGASSRLTGIVTALIVGGVLFIGGGLLEYFPKALLGGMLLLLGLSLVYDWIVAGCRRLPWPDYLIVVAIFLVIALFGFMKGVAFGLLAAVVFFVVRFSRVPAIESKFTALDCRSVKERSVPDRKILSAEGERIQGYRLTGYLFFGSAATLVDSLKSALASEPHPDYILLDFADVSGFDISAVNNFHRFALNAAATGTAVAVTAAPERFTEALKRNLPDKAMQNIAFFPDLDHGFEWCEDKLIEHTLGDWKDRTSVREALFDRSVDDVMAHLEKQERFEYLVDRLAPWLEHREHPAGCDILKRGETAGGLHLLTQGTSTELDPDTGIRKRGLMPGSVIAAAAAFGGFTAPTTIRADSNCKTAILSLEARGLLEQEDPCLAAALYGFIICASIRG
jgi:SulP family sulfate permease